jgi:hypothetical protein
LQAAKPIKNSIKKNVAFIAIKIKQVRTWIPPGHEKGGEIAVLDLPPDYLENISIFLLTSTMRHPKNYSKNFGQTTEQLIYVFG